MSGGEEFPGLATALFRVAVSLALALPIGWQRDRHSRSAGLRTFPIVAMGACAFVLTGWSALGPSSDEKADIIYGLVTGVGFIGSGAMMNDPEHFSGMATAVSLWVTVAIGTAAAFGIYVLAAAMAVLSFVSLSLMPQVEREAGS